MIRDTELKAIGRMLKPHGINGEIVVGLTMDIDLSKLSCVVVQTDGIFVPFFIESVRPKSSETDLVLIDGVCNERQAAAMCGNTLYALLKDLPEPDADADGGLYAEDLIGFMVEANGHFSGKITAVDDSTANYLFIIEKEDGGTCLLPVADEFIAEIDMDNRVLKMDVPEELLHL